MCGLFGIIFAPGTPYAQRESIITVASEAMTNRGTQSWGLAFTEPGQSPRRVRGIGEMADTEVGAIARRAHSVIGHTRLATDGAVTIDNCHPFKMHSTLVGGQMYVAHNGMIYNWPDFAEPADSVDSVVLGRKVAAGESPSRLDGYGTVVGLSHAGIHYARLDGGDADRVHVYDDDGVQVAAMVISSVGGPGRRYDVLADLSGLGLDAAPSPVPYDALRLLGLRASKEPVAVSSFALAPYYGVRDTSRTSGSDAGSKGYSGGAVYASQSWLHSGMGHGWGPRPYFADDILPRIVPGSLSVSDNRVTIKLDRADPYVLGESAPAGRWSTRYLSQCELVSQYGAGEVDLSDPDALLEVLVAAAEPTALDGGVGAPVLMEAWTLMAEDPTLDAGTEGALEAPNVVSIDAAAAEGE